MSSARTAACGLALIAVVTSCLSSLPDPLSCPAAARYGSPSTCLPALGSGPVPPPSAGPTCSLAIGCLLEQGRDCQCKKECSGTDACNPAPDCPDAVRRLAPSSTCVLASSKFPTPTACACGCASCAGWCDGYGPVLGEGPLGAIAAEWSGLPNSGRFGIMVRARGTGKLTATVDLDPASKTEVTGTVSSDAFQDVLLGPAMSWQGRPPAGMVLMSSAPGVEVDCIVPFFGPP